MHVCRGGIIVDNVRVLMTYRWPYVEREFGLLQRNARQNEKKKERESERERIVRSRASTRAFVEIITCSKLMNV